MTQMHKHQLPVELEGNNTWTAWIEIIHISNKEYDNNPHVEVEILLRDNETGTISPTDTKFLNKGDSITISPWKPRETISRPLPAPCYYWVGSKDTQLRYIAKWQYIYDKEAYTVHIPEHPTKKQWIANPTFYKGFYILDIPATLEEYEKANK